MTEATQRPSEDAMEFDEIFQASSTLPWAVIQDQYGNESIVDSMGDFVVEMAEQTIDADLIVKAVNSHDALVVAIEDMEESRENLEGLVQRLTIQNDALVAALEAAYDQLPCVCGDNFETCDCAVAKVTAALSEAVK